MPLILPVIKDIEISINDVAPRTRTNRHVNGQASGSIKKWENIRFIYYKKSHTL